MANNFKIVRLAGLHYDSTLNVFYSSESRLEELPYEEQKKKLLDNCFMYTGGFSREMRILGNDAHEIIYDAEPLQKKWLAENSGDPDSPEWQTQAVLSQIKKIRPDVIFFQDTHSLSHTVRKNLKKEFPFIKVIIIYKGYPGDFHELTDADIVLAGLPWMAKEYHKAGLNAHLLYHSFDSILAEKTQTIEKFTQDFYFTFLGSSGFAAGFAHRSRYDLLKKLLKETSLQAWLNESNSHSIKDIVYVNTLSFLSYALSRLSENKLNKLQYHPALPFKIKSLIKEVMKDKKIGLYHRRQSPFIYPLSKTFANRCHSPVFGTAMYDILRRSKISLNKHTDSARNEVGNMRLFQATGMGSCLLTDNGINIKDIFEPDREVVTYSSQEECLEKYHFLLNNEKYRSMVAEAGRKRTLRDHTTSHRCLKINSLIHEYLR